MPWTEASIQLQQAPDYPFTGEAYQGFDYGKSKKLCTASIKGGAVGLKS